MGRRASILLAVWMIGTTIRADGPAGRCEGQLKTLQEIYQAEKRDSQKQIIAERVLELARANPGDPAVVDALGWLVGRGLPSPTGPALELLVRDHIESERLVASCASAANTRLRDSLAAERLLRGAMSRSPHRRVRGMACHYLAEVLEDRADKLRSLARNPEATRNCEELLGAEGWKTFSRRGAEDLTAEAEALYERIIADYADLDTSRKQPLGVLDAGRLFRLRALRVGQVAPDIEGEDADGKRLRLGDYRGKVVLLTFSGNWCGPCRGFYPKERELVAKLKDRPFAALSVNTDEDRGTQRKSIDSGEITWRCWWDGGTGGPITLRWGVYYFPTVFVLDHEGIIRFA